MLSIIVKGDPLRIKEERVITVFPNDPDEMPQDFETYSEAQAYAEEKYGAGNYTIEEA